MRMMRRRDLETTRNLAALMATFPTKTSMRSYQTMRRRLFYASAEEKLIADAGWGSGVTEAAVRSFEEDIEQDREPEPDHPLWSILKIFAFRTFDWSDERLGWLLTKAIYATKKVSFGGMRRRS